MNEVQIDNKTHSRLPFERRLLEIDLNLIMQIQILANLIFIWTLLAVKEFWVERSLFHEAIDVHIHKLVWFFTASNELRSLSVE